MMVTQPQEGQCSGVRARDPLRTTKTHLCKWVLLSPARVTKEIPAER